jgi:hypothetical protein
VGAGMSIKYAISPYKQTIFAPTPPSPMRSADLTGEGDDRESLTYAGWDYFSSFPFTPPG